MPVIEYKTGNQQQFYSANFIYSGTDTDGKSLWTLGAVAPLAAISLDVVSVHLTDTPSPFVMTIDSILAAGQDYKVVFEFVGNSSEFVWKAVDISLN